MGSGFYFSDMNNPKVIVQVGNKGDIGSIEITEILFSAWVGDHDNDKSIYNQPDSSSTQISVFGARGMLIESEGPSWFYGGGSEHSVLYNYLFSGAKSVYLGHIQTESPYYQPNPAPPAPFRAAARFPNDPDFSECEVAADVWDDRCNYSWGVHIIDSQDVMIHSAGLYSFFNEYYQDCIPTHNCQDRILEVKGSTGVVIYNLFTVETINIASGIDDTNVPQDGNQRGFTTEISVRVPHPGSDNVDIVWLYTDTLKSRLEHDLMSDGEEVDDLLDDIDTSLILRLPITLTIVQQFCTARAHGLEVSGDAEEQEEPAEDDGRPVVTLKYTEKDWAFFIKILPIFSHVEISWDNMASWAGMMDSAYAKAMFDGLALRDGRIPSDDCDQRTMREHHGLTLDAREICKISDMILAFSGFKVDWESAAIAFGAVSVDRAKELARDLAHEERVLEGESDLSDM
ncbi:glycan 1-3-beta-glucosidase precursor [Apiospora sp. TS-2023a]